MLAIIVGLEALKEPCRVQVVSDSKYVIDAITKDWLGGWKRRNWMTAGKTPVKNVDLWMRMEKAMGGHDLAWQWVKGHSGHPMNERADELAVKARENEASWKVDDVFEQSQES